MRFVLKLLEFSSCVDSEMKAKGGFEQIESSLETCGVRCKQQGDQTHLCKMQLDGLPIGANQKQFVGSYKDLKILAQNLKKNHKAF